MARPRSNDPTQAVTLRLHASTMLAVERQATQDGVSPRIWLQTAVTDKLRSRAAQWPPKTQVKDEERGEQRAG